MFSELNSLTDLTMDETYANLLGYTQKELDTYFVDWINLWRKNSEFSAQAINKQLKDVSYSNYMVNLTI